MGEIEESLLWGKIQEKEREREEGRELKMERGKN